MYKHVLSSIKGVEIYPIISLIVFFVFFAAVLYWVFTLGKEYVQEMETMPLEEGNENLNKGNMYE